jgi:hypothetical protein
VKKKKMKNKALISLLVIFAVVLSTGVVYAVSPFDRGDSSVSEFSGEAESRFVLEDSGGWTWHLSIAFGVVLHGTVDTEYGTHPAYGFIFGDEMVLWANTPGGDHSDSVVHVGTWDFGTMKYTCYWVNYPFGSTGTIEMWPAGASAEQTEGIEDGDQRIAQSDAPSGTEDSEIHPQRAPAEKVEGEFEPKIDFGGQTERAAICLEDSMGYEYNLNMAYGCILYGKDSSNWNVYGFIFGDEMFLWVENPSTKDQWGYTGKWDMSTLIFDAKYVITPGGYTGSVEMWPCGAQKTEYYAVISGNGYNCAYADDDAYDMYDVLTSYGNWDPANIKLLVSTASGSKHDCTKTNIQNQIAWMASQADEDDVCVFFYAGHGGYQNDIAPIDEGDGYDEYICPEGGNIRDDELDTWMSATSGYKLVAIDSCFSGGFIKADGLESRCSGLPRVEITDGFAQDFCREDLCKTGWNVHTACDEDESAFGSGALQNGVFTYYFVEGLYGPADSEPDGDVDALEAHYYTRPKVQAYTGNVQNPWLCYYTSPNPLIWVE